MRELADATIRWQPVFMRFPIPFPNLSSAPLARHRLAQDADLETALEYEVSIERATQTISRMLEATRTAADGTAEPDWSAVAAQSYPAGMKTDAISPPGKSYLLPLRDRVKPDRQKQPLSRRIEDEEAL